MKNDVTPGRLPAPKVPKRPLGGTQPLARSRPVVAPAAPQAPTIPIEDNGALDLPPALPPQALELERRPKRTWVKRLFLAFMTLVLLGIAAGVGAYFWYKDALQPLSTSQERIKVEVAAGAAADQVAATLEEKKLVKSALALQIYIKLHGKGSIKAGNYVFTPGQGPFEIVEWLTQGKVDTFKLTILPGKTLAEIKKKLQEDGYSAGAVDAAYSHQYNHPLLADKPAGTTLEGYIYPETYFVSSDTPLETVFTQGFDLLQNDIERKGIKSALAGHNLSVYQGMTLASIIEKEVHNTADKRQVSQVFLKRLGEGGRLASDPTYKYAAAMLGIPPSTEIESPYNTYKNTGLPPGPIANFTVDSLEAVGNPATGDFLYFVAGDDGTTHFSRTFEEHERNIRQYCQKLCSTF